MRMELKEKCFPGILTESGADKSKLGCLGMVIRGSPLDHGSSFRDHGYTRPFVYYLYLLQASTNTIYPDRNGAAESSTQAPKVITAPARGRAGRSEGASWKL